MKVGIFSSLRRIVALSSFLAFCGILTFAAVNVQAQGAVCEPNLPPGISYQSVVNTLFPEGILINPSYVTDAASPNLLGLSPTTTVAVTFLGFVSGNQHNRLGYFLFDETNTITNAGAVVFEDASAATAGVTTTEIGPFAANSNVGFFMDVNGNSNPDLTFYSLINLNVDDVRHFAAATEIITIWFLPPVCVEPLTIAIFQIAFAIPAATTIPIANAPSASLKREAAEAMKVNA